MCHSFCVIQIILSKCIHICYICSWIDYVCNMNWICALLYWFLYFCNSYNRQNYGRSVNLSKYIVLSRSKVTSKEHSYTYKNPEIILKKLIIWANKLRLNSDMGSSQIHVVGEFDSPPCKYLFQCWFPWFPCTVAQSSKLSNRIYWIRVIRHAHLNERVNFFNLSVSHITLPTFRSTISHVVPGIKMY